MRDQHFKAGETIYREGADSDAVFFVKEGGVQVWRDVAGERVPLGMLGEGEIFGEMGVIRGVPRSTTAEAATDLTLLAMHREQFLEAFGQAPLALKILRMLCERLSHANDQLVGTAPQRPAAPAAHGQGVRILPGSHAVGAQIGEDGVRVRSLPFYVGRRLVDGEPPLERKAELALAAKEKHRLSPHHFAIENEDGRLIVRDLGSHLGTIVNGRRIAEFDYSTTATLHTGRNLIQAGGTDTPYAFVVMIDA